MDYLYLIGSAQAFFFALIILQSKKRFMSDNILLIWLLAYSIHLLIPFFAYNPKLILSNFTIGVDIAIAAFHPAIMYIYFRSFSEKHLKVFILLHLSPFVVTTFFMLPFFTQAYEQKITLLNDFHSLPLNVLIAVFIGSAVNVVYLILSYRLLKSYKAELRWVVSHEKRLSLKWIWFVFWGNLLMLILNVFGGFVLFDFGFRLYEIDIYMYGALSVYLFVFALTGIKFSNLYNLRLVNIQERKDARLEVKKNIDYSGEEENIQHLQYIMNSEKPYLNERLSIFDLSEIVGVSSNNLSRLINQELKCNFFDFVNTYRVEEVKKQLQQKNNYSLVSIAFECGFNSKASFNRIFKKQTGMTPSEYQKKKVSQSD